MPPTQNVAVQVRHRLAGIRTVVQDQPKARLCESLPARNLSRLQEQVTQHFLVLRCGIGDPRDGLPGHDEDVDRRAWLDILESDHVLVFVNELGRNLAIRNFLKQCFDRETVACCLSRVMVALY